MVLGLDDCEIPPLKLKTIVVILSEMLNRPAQLSIIIIGGFRIEVSALFIIIIPKFHRVRRAFQKSARSGAHTLQLY